MAPVSEAVVEEFEILSCAPEAMYRGGGFYDGSVGLDRLIDTARRHAGNITTIAEIFPAQSIRHPMPRASLDQDPEFAEVVAVHFRHIQASFTHIAPSLLVRIRQAIIWQNMLFAVVGDRAVPIYEFYRTIDRTEKGRYLLSRLSVCESHERLDLSGTNALFVGSAGSFNYGHWLADDFPALAAGRELRRGRRPMTVLMSSFADDIDRIRTEGTALALGETDDYSVKMLDRQTAYHVKNLYYVTPSTYHPFLKNPVALRFIRETCVETLINEPSCAISDKLFINRAEGSPRRLVNNDAVVEAVKSQGFCEFLPDRLSLREQWATFAGGRQIIGVMGAAMTSTVLCAPGSKLTYLAPVGWIEPFYWTLSTMCGHDYATLFGSAAESTLGNYRKSFAVDVDQLVQHLSSF